MEAVGRGFAQRGLEVGALQQTRLDQLAQVLFPARLLAAQELQQGVLAGVEQALGGVLFLLAFGHLAGRLLVLLGEFLALAQQLAFLLGQGLDLLAGCVALLVGLFQTPVEDVQAAAFLFAVAELVDALLVILALQLAGMFLLAVGGFRLLAAAGEGFVQLAQRVVLLLGAGGQFVAHLAFLPVQAIQRFLLALLDDLLAFQVGVLHVGVLLGEQAQTLLEVVQLQLPAVELLQIGLGLVDIGIQILLVLLLDVVELFFVALNARLHLGQIEAQRVALLFPVAFQAIEFEADLLQLALQGFLAGEQLRLVGAEGLQQAAEARLATLQFLEIALQTGEFRTQVGEALDELAVANPVLDLLGTQAGGRRGDAVLFENGGDHRLDGFHLAFARMHGAHQLLDMPQAVLAAAQRELPGQLAQFATLAVGGQQGAVVLDDRPVLAGVELVADRHAELAEMPAQLVHGAADDAVALAAADVVLQVEALVYQPVVHAAAVAAGGEDRLAGLVVHALVFVDDEALLGGQVPALEAVTGGRHHAARVFAVEHRHQALQGGLAGGVGAADVGVVVHDQLHHTLEVGVDQNEAIQAGHASPSKMRSKGAV